MTGTAGQRRGTATSAHGQSSPPTRQLTWTRLGNWMGYTDSEPKRAEIRIAVETMTWRDPTELDDALNVAPARQVIASLFCGRRWALHQAAIAALPHDAEGRPRRLIGLQAVTGERHLLLELDYEVIHLCTDRPVRERAMTR